MLNCSYAIIPDDSLNPVALFSDLEDAMDWGLQHFGGQAFKIKHIAVAVIEHECPAKPGKVVNLVHLG
jgi:hypothetical protein